VEELSPAVTWRVRAIEITGNQTFSSAELRAQIVTQERSWYTPWRDRPIFEPQEFLTDLERIRRYYEARGYYDTRVAYDLELDDSLVTAKIEVHESEPVRVAEVKVGIKGTRKLALPAELPIKTGEIFTEADYQQGDAVLKQFFLDQTYAHVEVERSTRIDLAGRKAFVGYVIDLGPEARFGGTGVEGMKAVDPRLITREIEWQPGEPFSLQKIDWTRQNLLDLNLFASVQIGWETNQRPETVRMTIRVREKPPREVKLGVGYSTEDQYRLQAEWKHYNWFGGGRQLSVSGQYAGVTSTIGAQFTQPHFLSRRTAGVLQLRQDQQDEDTYLLYATRFRPRLEHRFSRQLRGTLAYRTEFAKLSNIDDATDTALGGVKRSGLLSGPSLSLIYDSTDSPLDPKTGNVVTFQADQPGVIWGGDFAFWKATVEGKKYVGVGWQTVLAGRIELGLADSLGSDRDFPIFERFYAGGEKSVRGYGRRRLGPRSAADDPIGGLSLVEGSLELRRPIWGALGGALFLDFGQVDVDAYRVPFDDLKFAAGPGVTYTTPIGPLRLDLGIPFQPPAGDSSWQIHFSIGQFF
jgi:outer membrane protein assembly complex protein YaeT